MRPKKVTAYRCPECETVNSEPPVKVKGYTCPQCDQVHIAEELEITTAWRVGDVGENGLVLDEPIRTQVNVFECGDFAEVGNAAIVDIYQYDCGCDSESEPEEVEAYECGECNEVYEERDEARECCK